MTSQTSPSTRNAETFKKTLDVLWGFNGQTVFARLHGVGARTVRLWIYKDTVPAAAWDTLVKAAKSRETELSHLVKSLTK